MNEKTMPKGIRKSAPHKDGSFTFEARINRQGIKFSKHLPTVKEALNWKMRTDALIESGIDPREREENNSIRFTSALPNKVTSAAALPAAEGRDEAPVPQVSMTVEQAVDGYLAHRQASHLKLKANQVSEYKRPRDDLGNMIIANMVNKDLANYITLLLSTPRKRDAQAGGKASIPKVALEILKSAKARANARYKEKIRAEKPPRQPKPLAEATVRKYLLALKTAIKWQAKNNGVEFHRFLFEFDSKAMPAAWNGKRDRRLLAGEEEKLYAAGIDRGDYTYTQDDWRMLIGFALETAMRQQELAFAKWEDLQKDRSKLFIPKKNSKTNKDRYILLSARAREILKVQEATCPKKEKRIFHQYPNAKAMCDSFMKLTTRAEIRDLKFHDLRHEATSRLCEKTGRKDRLSLMEIMEMTGHDTMTTFKGYVKLIAHENSRRLK